jgi:hypothetical protein
MSGEKVTQTNWGCPFSFHHAVTGRPHGAVHFKYNTDDREELPFKACGTRFICLNKNTTQEEIEGVLCPSHSATFDKNTNVCHIDRPFDVDYKKARQMDCTYTHP